jgi:hypothetical protein
MSNNAHQPPDPLKSDPPRALDPLRALARALARAAARFWLRPEAKDPTADQGSLQQPHSQRDNGEDDHGAR